MLPCSMYSPMCLPPLPSEYSIAALSSYGLAILTTPLMLSLIRDYLRRQISFRMYALLRHVLPKPDRPDYLSVKAAEEDILTSDIPIAGMGVAVGHGNRYHGPRTMLATWKATFPILRRILQTLFGNRRHPWSELSPGLGGRLSRRAASIYRRERTRYTVAGDTRRYSDRMVRRLAVREALYGGGQVPGMAEMDIDELAEDLSDMGSETSTRTPDLFDDVNMNEHERTESGAGQGIFPAWDVALDVDNQNAAPVLVNEGWIEVHYSQEQLVAPAQGISRAPPLPHTTPRRVRRPTEVDDEIGAITEALLEPDEAEDLRRRGRDLPVSTFRRPITPVYIDHPGIMEMEEYSINNSDKQKYRVTALSNHSADSLAWHASALLTTICLIPFYAMYSRSLAYAFLSWPTSRPGALQATEAIRADVLPVWSWVGVNESAIGSRLNHISHLVTIVGTQAVISLGLWRLGTNLAVWAGRTTFGWGKF